MKVALSFTDLRQATREFQRQVGGQRQHHQQETLLCLPSMLGKGYLRGTNLRPGLDLFVSEYDLNQDLVLDFRKLSNQHSFVSLNFCLSGQTRGRIPGLKDNIEVNSGQSTFSAIPYASGTSEVLAGEPLKLISLSIAPQLLLSLVEADLREMPIDWQQRLKNAVDTPYIQPSYTTAEIAHILQLVLQCPHQGAVRRLYLESKALELLALCILQFTSSPINTWPSGRVRRRDIDSLHQAKDILLQNMNSPPSLAELAQQVSVDERKLQQGFQQIFGTTVFGVLHDYRMEQARQLLEADQMTVEAIANKVGIAHRGYFAKAFKRKFGSTPRDYLKRLR